MAEAALIDMIHRIFNGTYNPVSAILESEIKRGHKIVRPGDAEWLPLWDWNRDTVCSIIGSNARLVLIAALRPGNGAFTRTLAKINEAGLVPTVVEPTRELAETLKRRNWGSRTTGTTFETRETLWFPRRDKVEKKS